MPQSRKILVFSNAAWTFRRTFSNRKSARKHSKTMAETPSRTIKYKKKKNYWIVILCNSSFTRNLPYYKAFCSVSIKHAVVLYYWFNTALWKKKKKTVGNRRIQNRSKVDFFFIGSGEIALLTSYYCRTDRGK